MIDIQIVPEEFQYDVQSMVQAFYMGHPFKINSQVQDYYRILKVVYEENRINTPPGVKSYERLFAFQ